MEYLVSGVLGEISGLSLQCMIFYETTLLSLGGHRRGVSYRGHGFSSRQSLYPTIPADLFHGSSFGAIIGAIALS